MREYTQFYINGQWVDPVAPQTLEVLDPSTEEACATISLGSEADVDLAVAAAKAAFESFSQTSVEERVAMLERMAEIAEWFTGQGSADDYRRVATEAQEKFADPDRTLSARMLREMEESGLSYSQLALRYSRQWHAQHLNDPLSEEASTRLTAEAEQSIQRQHAIEAQDSETLEEYLSLFYRQYQAHDA